MSEDFGSTGGAASGGVSTWRNPGWTRSPSDSGFPRIKTCVARPFPDSYTHMTSKLFSVPFADASCFSSAEAFL